MSDKSDYFDYVSTVLGVKSVYIEPQAATAGLKEVIPLLVSVENLSTYAPEEKDLLEKMVSALKIDLQKIKICDISKADSFESAFTIRFSDNLSGSSLTENSLTTFSPRTLLKNPSLKKQVWNEFQTVIKFFSN